MFNGNESLSEVLSEAISEGHRVLFCPVDDSSVGVRIVVEGPHGHLRVQDVLVLEFEGANFDILAYHLSMSVAFLKSALVLEGNE